MGKATSLPKQALGALRLSPPVELCFGQEAQARLTVLNATRYEAFWKQDSDFLVSLVLLFCN
jgi:hypothetical protein